MEQDDRKFEVTWKTNETDSFPEYRQTSMRELSEIAKDSKITHLGFKHDYPDKLPADVRDSLVWLDIPDKPSHAVLSDLPSLRSLTVHGDGISMISSQLDTQLSMFKSLKKLTLKNFRLLSIPQSISDLTELEEFTLTANSLSLSDGDYINEILSSLKKLKKLDLSNCGLYAVPSSICTLDQLEHLLIEVNWDLCGDMSLNSKLSRLKSLKTLNIGGCGLKEIPSGICSLDQLEHLLIQNNEDLSNDTSLNSKLSQLKSLKTLNILRCGLKEIPSGIKEMTQLTDLNMALNFFSDDSIPTWFTELRSLKTLDISHFETLKILPPSLVSLTKLNCKGCTALVEPPYFVCSGGMNNIKQYYKDMEAGKHSMTLSTIVVIGQKMAGKSSLVKSLTRKKIVKTQRDNSAPGLHQRKKDETTKAFDFAQLELSNGLDEYKHTVNVIDFGGDEIYHSAYYLTFKKDCVPIVVTNMEEYKELSGRWGPREAARRLVFEWIAHLFLACPDIGDPILVLTHIDTLRFPESACSYRDELVKTLDELLSDLKNQNSVSTKIGFFQRGFAKSEICEIRHDKPYGEVFKELEVLVCRRVKSSSVNLPISWKEIITYMKDQSAASLVYRNLQQEMNPKSWSREQLDVVLDFLQRAGEILWYQNISPLSGTIFHQVEEVTKVIRQLFDHSISEHKGIVKADTLSRLLTPLPNTWCTKAPGASTSHQIEAPVADPNQIKADTAIELLKAFNLIHGPVSYNGNPRCYLIPQLMSPHEFPAPTGDIQLRTDMNFVGLSIPSYAYQQSTITVLSSLDESSTTQVFPYGNGISCRVAKSRSEPVIDINLIHEIVEQRVILRVEGQTEVITNMWHYLLKLIKDLSKSFRDVWPASKITYELPCSHCLITNKLNPEKRTNPDFIMLAAQGRINQIHYKSVGEETKCGKQRVPAALRSPVRMTTDQDLEVLKAEMKTLLPRDEVKNLQSILEQQGKVLDLQPELQTSLYTHPMSIPKVYHMTPTRGRALIINDKASFTVDERLGSENDFINIRTMLETFGFVISGLSGDKDWTGEEMVDAIHEETQYVDRVTGSSVHDCLGMFVLVLMSHGGLGTIKGCRGKILRLKDIYGLLSSYNFPAMKGKPKLIILQACTGDEKERIDFTAAAVSNSSQIPPSANNEAVTLATRKGKGKHHPTQCYSKQNKATEEPVNPASADVDATPPVESRPVPDIPLPPEVDLDNSHLSVDDLLIMKPSFEDFVSFLDEEKGSYFIRAVAAAFYLYAAQKDLRTLADTTIQEAVRMDSKCYTMKWAEDAGQVPVTTCTFTKDRKLYLSPGVNMNTKDTHPKSITDPRPPDRMTTVIRWKDKSTDTPRFDAVPNP